MEFSKNLKEIVTEVNTIFPTEEEYNNVISSDDDFDYRKGIYFCIKCGAEHLLYKDLKKGVRDGKSVFLCPLCNDDDIICIN